MVSVIAHYLPREMALLGLIEGLLSFAAVSLAIGAAEASVAITPGLSLPLGGSMHAGLGITICLTMLISGVALGAGLYRPDVCVDGKRLLSGWSALLAALAVLLVVAGAAENRLSADYLLWQAKLLAGWGAAIALTRLLHGLMLGQRRLVRRVALVGIQAEPGRFEALLERSPIRRFQPVRLPREMLTWPGPAECALWGLIMLDEPDASAKAVLLDCKLRGMRIMPAAAFQEAYLGRLDLAMLSVDGLLAGRHLNASAASAAVKRCSDIVLALLLLALTLPLMLAVAAAVKLDSRGPVLYRQQRTGQFGRPFTLLKFRSMAADAEAGGKPAWAQKRDPRITRVGRFIRTTRIDELPQLVNVLSGEMSLVGPRPERPHFVEQLARAIPFYEVRAYVKPGLTGWAQVNFPYGASVEDAREKLAYDLYYVKNRSCILDLAILFATVRVVLRGEGAR